MPLESQPSRHWVDGVLVGRGDQAVSDVAAGPAPTNPALLPATPFTVETADNPWDEGGTINVLTFPNTGAVLAVKIEGDDFPRLLWGPGLGTMLFVGDGTANPEAAGAGGTIGFAVTNDDSIPAVSTSALVVNDVQDNWGDQIFQVAGAGPVLIAPDATRYRIKVANGGTLSAEAVV